MEGREEGRVMEGREEGMTQEGGGQGPAHGRRAEGRGAHVFDLSPGPSVQGANADLRAKGARRPGSERRFKG